MKLSHCIDILPYTYINMYSRSLLCAGAVYVRMCVHACVMYTVCVCIGLGIYTRWRVKVS